MKSFQVVLALCLALAPATAFAQTTRAVDTGMTVNIDGGDSENGSLLWLYLNAKHCATETTTVTFKIETALPSVAENLEIWHGPENVECWKGAARTESDSGKTDCTQVPVGNYTFDKTRNPLVSTTARQLFPDSENKTCGVSGDRWLYVMSLDTPTSGATMPGDAAKGTYYRVKLSVDTTLPAAPASVSGSDGESSIEVEWEGPDEILADIMRPGQFRVYWDPTARGTISDATCRTSTVLTAGGNAPTGANAKYSSSSTEGKSFSPGSLGLVSFGDKVPVAVTAVDPAGNEGKLSEVVCVSKVDTITYYDACKADKDCALHKCSASPFGGAPSALVALSMIGCAAAFVRRRRNV